MIADYDRLIADYNRLIAEHDMFIAVFAAIMLLPVLAMVGALLASQASALLELLP